jgi:transcription initiation factor TFIIE subunit alpha
MHLFDPRTNTFQCEDDHTELIEHQPEDQSAGAGEAADKLQRFNQATTPIRDVLKDIDGAKVPSVHIMAWIAKNVKVQVDLHEEEKEDKNKISVVLGEGDERERIEKERLAEQQRSVPLCVLSDCEKCDAGERVCLRDSGLAS